MYKNLMVGLVLLNNITCNGAEAAAREAYVKSVYEAILRTPKGAMPVGNDAATLAVIDLNMFDHDKDLPLTYITGLYEHGLDRSGVAKFLLEHGHDVNQRQANDQITPLHMAVAMCHTNMVDLLLEHDAAIDIVTQLSGQTAVELAIEFKESTLKGGRKKHDFSIEECIVIGGIAKKLVLKRDGAPDEPAY